MCEFFSGPLYEYIEIGGVFFFFLHKFYSANKMIGKERLEGPNELEKREGE